MSATINTSNRLTGMFSGLDTDALVKAMVSTQQKKVDLLFQNRERATWKRDAYTDFNNQLRIFREDYGSAIGTKSMTSQGTFYNSKAELASNQYLSVTTTSSAKEGSYSVRIDQLASAAAMNGARATDTQSGLSSNMINNTEIGSIASFASGAYGNEGGFSFTINGKDFAFKSTDTLKTVMDTVNKSGAGVTMSYSQATDSFKIVSGSMGEYRPVANPGEAPVEENPFTMEKPVSSGFDSDEEYQEALKEYNEARAEYDAGEGKEYKDALAAWKKNSQEYLDSEKRNITFSDTDGFLSHIGLSQVTAGTDAKISINGGETRTFTENLVTLDGVTFNLLGVTEPGKSVDFNVKRNPADAVDKVKAFVDSFNELVGKLYTSASTKRDYKYSPLTDEQRDALSEAEAEKWDEKARQGIMYRDSNVTKLLGQLREMLTSELGDGGRLKDIGITVSKYAVGEPFKLELDTEKLTQALNEDPEKAYNIFSSPAAGSNKGGLMTRINNSITEFTTNTKSVAIQTLNNSIESLTKQMSTQEDKITDMSEKYYLQYAKLETALQQMQSQQGQLSSLFGTGS